MPKKKSPSPSKMGQSKKDTDSISKKTPQKKTHQIRTKTPTQCKKGGRKPKPKPETDFYFGAKQLPRTSSTTVVVESTTSQSGASRTKSPVRSPSQKSGSSSKLASKSFAKEKCLQKKLASGLTSSAGSSRPSISTSSSSKRTNHSSSSTPPSSSKSKGSRDGGKKKKPNLLLSLRPTNVESEKARFMARQYDYDQRFIYLNPPEATAMQRFDRPSKKLLDQAIKIMQIVLRKYGTYENFEAHTGGRQIPRQEFTQMFKEYVNMEDKVILNIGDEILSRAIMTRSKGKPCLNVRVNTLREKWAPGMLRHELGTHCLRGLNNKQQPWHNSKGRERHNLRPLNPTEEGLANIHSVLYRDDPSLWRAALLYYTAYKASLMSFSELFKDLEQFVMDPEIRWQYCVRVKRGLVDTSEPGCFSKDQVYLTGVFEILKYCHRIDFHSMVRMGKIAYQDVERLKPRAVLDEKIVKIPFFMADMKDYKARLHFIMTKNGITDVDLVRLYPDSPADSKWWTATSY